MVKLGYEICSCAIYIKDQDSGEQYGLNAFISNGQESSPSELDNQTIWLNAGTKIMKTSSNSGTYNISYSAIEFNIVD